MNHVTSPSGTGPMKSIPQPPGWTGFCAQRTYRTTESSCRSFRSLSVNRGMTYGPIRTASAICTGVDCCSGGATAPLT